MEQPPFRADHIGSLLRPVALLELRRRFEAGKIEYEELRAAEDAAIEDAIALQKRVGLNVVTDGEFRRHAYHDFFFEHLGDVAIGFSPVDAADTKNDAKRATQPAAIVKTKLEWKAPIHAQELAFLRERSGAMVKITLPGPCALHFRGGTPAILRHGAYDDIDAFWDDIVEAYAREFASLAESGCTYVQIDETAFAKFGDPAVRHTLAERGEHWETVVDDYIGIINRVLANVPAGVQVGMHLCRGNRGGHFHAEGGYDAVAEKLFNTLDFGFYLLEYDSPRAGNFAPLRFLPADKSVVLGLVSTKSEKMEMKEDVKRRIDEAAAYADLDRLALSPQCGFASVASGNPVTPDTQEAKLRLVVETASDVWGDA